MNLLISNANCQVAGFAITTLGWIFSMTCMGLSEWRVWHMENNTVLSPGLACVGMWKVCIYHPTSYYKRNIACHRYAYTNTYLPTDIRVAQNLLLAASILGLLGKVLMVLALRNVYVRGLQKNATWNLFVASGLLSIIAGIFISIAVIWNYHSVMNKEGINFPQSFHIPVTPDRQEMGSTVLVAILAAFLMLLSGLFALSYKLPQERQVYPEVAEV